MAFSRGEQEAGVGGLFSSLLCVCGEGVLILLSFGCTGSSLLCEGFLVKWGLLSCGAQASSPWWLLLLGTRALGTWALVVVVHRLVAPQHVGSSLTRDQTHVSYIGRWTVIHWTTREVLFNLFKPCIHGMCAKSLQFFATLWTVTCRGPALADPGYSKERWCRQPIYLNIYQRYKE